MSDVPVVEQKPVEVTDIPAVPAAVEPPKTEETQVVTETPAAVVEETPKETPVPEDPKEAEKPAETEKVPKGPGILAKLIAPFKTDRKKGPKSPKKPETPATEEAPKPKPEETPAATDAVAETPKEVAAEPVKETETPAVEVPAAVAAAVTSVVEPLEKSKSKFTRRLSARVGDLFKKNRSEVPTTAKVDEHPPKIDEPTPVAPLENPASESSVPAETPAEPAEPVKPIEPAPAATPVVAAAAA